MDIDSGSGRKFVFLQLCDWGCSRRRADNGCADCGRLVPDGRSAAAPDHYCCGFDILLINRLSMLSEGEIRVSPGGALIRLHGQGRSGYLISKINSYVSCCIMCYVSEQFAYGQPYSCAPAPPRAPLVGSPPQQRHRHVAVDSYNGERVYIAPERNANVKMRQMGSPLPSRSSRHTLANATSQPPETLQSAHRSTQTSFASQAQQTPKSGGPPPPQVWRHAP